MPTTTYRNTRLTFRRDLIEPLKDHESFRVETPVGIFQMTKRNFYEVFKSVTKSKSYCNKGLYNYMSVPQKALDFIIDVNKTIKSKSQYDLPLFLAGICTPAVYKRWLQRKAMAHFKRDSKRGIKIISCSSYKHAIHQAVFDGGQHDAYTGERLDWTLISKYDNDESKKGKRGYKKRFALLPTVDHVDGDYENPRFKICSWRVNDCKNDLDLNTFLVVCKKVLAHQYKKEV